MVRRLYICVIFLVTFNLFLLMIYPPWLWKLGRRSSYLYEWDIRNVIFNESMFKNVTEIQYKINGEQNTKDNCIRSPKLLVGALAMNLNISLQSFQEINSNQTQFSRLMQQEAVAVFKPSNCQFTHTIAIIIPFRNREEHLQHLLGHLLPILQRQFLRYSIFVVTQQGNGIFNKGRLMNTGFVYALKTGQRSGVLFDCFIFHDVDLLVEHDTLLYRCSKGNTVNHFSTSIDKFGYHELCCGMTVGGVLAFSEQQFRKVNGYPNGYWGWGGEDDDMNARIFRHRLKIQRPGNEIGRYTMIKHDPDKGNPWNSDVDKNLRTAVRRFASDGLSNLDTRVVKIDCFPLFTNILVNVGKKP